MSKPRIIKDYEKLNEDIIAQIKLRYPFGFDKELIQFKNKDGALIMALPYESDDYYYLIRMTRRKAEEIMDEDEDFDDEGFLTEEAKERLDNETQKMDDDE